MKGIKYMYGVEVIGIANKLDTALNVFTDKNDVQNLVRAHIKEDIKKIGYEVGNIGNQYWVTICLECNKEINSNSYLYCPFCGKSL